MDAWRRILDKYANRPYAWPDAYCGATLDDMLTGELGAPPQYAVIARRAATEADMLGWAMKRHGSVGAAHDGVLTAVRGVFRVLVKHGEGAPAVARVAWIDDGRVRVGGELSEPLSDRRGAMLLRGPATLDARPWFMWTPDGLAETCIAGAHVARAWGW